MKTIVYTKIKNEMWVASTPHMPDITAESAKEHIAVNLLIDKLRERFGKGPVEWIINPDIADDKDTIVRGISGIWPEDIVSTSTTDNNSKSSTPKNKGKEGLENGTD